MAELLIIAANHTHPNPEVDRASVCKAGMVLRVVRDGYEWDRYTSKQQWIKEGFHADDWVAKGVIIKIPGMAIPKVRELLDRQTVDDLGVETGRTFRFRAWRILKSGLPAPLKARLRNDGEITVTKAQIRNFIKRIRDNRQFEGMD